jgi:hypothetical protein
MKVLKTLSLTVAFSVMAYAQTQDLGMGAFSNENSPIMMAVDTAFASRQLDNPYVYLVLYMAARNPGQDITVSRNDVVMV